MISGKFLKKESKLLYHESFYICKKRGRNLILMKEMNQSDEWNLELPEWDLDIPDWNIEFPEWEINLPEWELIL